jgi:hypothetical protein
MVALVGWFDPRGLASVLFALPALEELGSPTADHAVTVITTLCRGTRHTGPQTHPC